MQKGKIILTRKTGRFEAAYGIMAAALEDIHDHSKLLHPKEKSQLQHLKYERRKNNYLLGRLAAKKALSVLVKDQSLDTISVDTGVFQFPVINGCQQQNIQVSISHSDTIGIALAFPAEHPLGIDIEAVDPDKGEAMKSQIEPNELALTKSTGLNELSAATLIWTAKEALSKVLKTGMTVDFKFFELASVEKVGETYHSTFRHFMQYQAISFPIEDYVCSIILPGKSTPQLDDFQQSFETTLQAIQVKENDG